LNGVSFSEFKGYEDWQVVAVSRTSTTVKAMLGNPAMIRAHKSGIPGNGKPFPEGVKIAKIMWAKKTNTGHAGSALLHREGYMRSLIMMPSPLRSLLMGKTPRSARVIVTTCAIAR